MKLLAVLLLVGCAYASVPPVVLTPGSPLAEQRAKDILKVSHPVDVEQRNWLIDQAVNLVVNQAINFIRNTINNGSILLGVPPLDPLDIEHLHVYLPAGLINLDLDLQDIHATGFGGFLALRSNLNIRTLILQLEISIPLIEVRSKYDLIGDLFGAIPLYGKGDAEFIVENFRFAATLQLAQSEDGESVIIDSIDNINFDIPSFKSNLTGVIGGGNIDKIVNAIIEEVIIGYVIRFHNGISLLAGPVVMAALNPILNSLDTWKFIAPFV